MRQPGLRQPELQRASSRQPGLQRASLRLQNFRHPGNPKRAILLFLLAVVLFRLALPSNLEASFLKKLGKALKIYHEANQILWLLGDPAAERRFGYAFSRFMMAIKPIDRNKARNAWVRKVFRRVVDQCRRNRFQYRVYVVRDKSINAFALPGGYIFVNRGMLEFVRSDDELACILAHELAHVNRRHSLKRLRRNTAFVALAKKVLGDDKSDRTWASIANIFLELRFSRNNEREADRLGMKWARNAGYDPSGMVSLWDRMLKKYGSNRNELTKWFATHPGHRERASNGRRLLKKWNIPFKETKFLTLGIRTVKKKHLLENGSFERGSKQNGLPLAWRMVRSFDLFQGEADSGEHSLVSKGRRDGEAPLILSEFFPFQASKTIKLKGSIKAGSPFSKGSRIAKLLKRTREAPDFWLGLEFYDEKKKSLARIFPAAKGATPPWGEWKRYFAEVGMHLPPRQRPPEDAAHFSLIAMVGRKNPGLCWIDSLELSLEEGSPSNVEDPRGSDRYSPRANLLPNGSFERAGSSRRDAARWVISSGASRSRNSSDSGKFALLFEGKKEMRREFAISEMIAVNPGARYILEGRFSSQSPSNVSFGYRLFSRDKRLIRDSTRIRDFPISRRPWTTRELRISTAKASPARFIQVSLRAQPKLGHKIWIDDLKLYNANVR